MSRPPVIDVPTAMQAPPAVEAPRRPRRRSGRPLAAPAQPPAQLFGPRSRRAAVRPAGPLTAVLALGCAIAGLTLLAVAAAALAGIGPLGQL